MDRFLRFGTVPPEKAYSPPLLKLSNDPTMESVTFDPVMQRDYELLKRVTGLVAFYYGPPLWMVGLTEDYEALDGPSSGEAAKRIVQACRARQLGPDTTLYRIRLNIEGDPFDPKEYDSPPSGKKSSYDRFDSECVPLMYTSPDIDTCIHECRTRVADEAYLATLRLRRKAHLLDLTAPREQGGLVTPFEDVEVFLENLAWSGEAEYPKCRRIAEAIMQSGYDGFVFRSYYAQVGQEPKENVALFGWPISAGHVGVTALNRVRLDEVRYELRYGPVLP